MAAANERESRPVMHGAADASPDEIIRGLLDQIAADVHRFPNIDAEAVFRRWIKDAGVEPSDSEISAFVSGLRQRGVTLSTEHGQHDGDAPAT